MADFDVEVTLDEVAIDVTLEQTVVEVTLAGPTGPAAIGAVDAHYEQAFTSASTVSVTHNLDKYPAVTVIDSAGDEVMEDIQHASSEAFTVTFSAPFSGTVFCN